MADMCPECGSPNYKEFEGFVMPDNEGVGVIRCAECGYIVNRITGEIVDKGGRTAPPTEGSEEIGPPSMTNFAEQLKGLGSDETQYAYDKVSPEVLETFPSPAWVQDIPEDERLNKIGAGMSIHIEIPEFTSLCPKTGQPDFAKIVIDYTPRELCVESKSLKLYMGSYRNVGEFHEACIVRMTNDFVDAVEPFQIQITGEFTPRGGIPFWPTAHWTHPSIQAQMAGQQRASRIIAPPGVRH